MSPHCLFCLTNCPKLKDIEFTIIEKLRKKKLELEVRRFFFGLNVTNQFNKFIKYIFVFYAGFLVRHKASNFETPMWFPATSVPFHIICQMKPQTDQY